MALRSSSQNKAANNTISTLVPTGAAIGDIMILVMSVDEVGGIVSTLPSGFVALATLTGFGPDGQSAHVAWKRLAAADTGSYTYTGASPSHAWVLQAYCFSGRDASNPPVISTTASSNASNASPVTATANGVTALSGDDLLYALTPDANASAATTMTAPSGYTKQLEENQGFSNVAAATKENVGAGATGSVASSYTCSTTSGWGAWVVRVPSAGGGGSDLTVSVSDSTTTTETPQRSLDSFALASDSTSTAETLTLQCPSPLSVNESASTSETISIAAPRPVSVSDSTSATDTLALQCPSPLSVSDSTSTSETVSVALPGLSSLSIGVSDSASTADTPALQCPSPVSVSDSSSTSESVTVQFAGGPSPLSVSASDASAVSEQIAFPNGPILYDPIDTSESVNVVIPASGPLSANVSDSTSTAEWVVIASDPPIDFSLEVNVSDAATTSESVNLLVTVAGNLTISISDTIASSEATNATGSTSKVAVSDSTATIDVAVVFVNPGGNPPNTHPPLGGTFDDATSGGTFNGGASGGNITTTSRGGNVTFTGPGGTPNTGSSGGTIKKPTRGGIVQLPAAGGDIE